MERRFSRTIHPEGVAAVVGGLDKKIKPPGIFHLHPFAIDIHGDIAIVFLSFQVVDKLKDGSEIKEQGKWTEIYRKIDGKWLVISETGFDFKTTTD